MTPGCAFCTIVSADPPLEVLAYEDALTAAFPSLHQRTQNRGQMLVIPRKHVPFVYDLDVTVGAALMVAIATVSRGLKAAFGATGVTVIQHNEPDGGQDVFHVHFHVIPRFRGDGFYTNDDRFPLGQLEVPAEQRRAQAMALRAAMN